MTTVLALVALVGALTIGAPRLLLRARWPHRAPAAGILAWRATSVAALVAMLLVGLTMALPVLPVTTDFAEWIGACSDAVRERYSTPGGATVGVVGAMLVALVVARFVTSFADEAVAVRRLRRQLRQRVAVVATQRGDGVLTVDHPDAAVYCIPGRHSAVVVSTGAVRSLGQAQLAAALAHERAHLADRHGELLLLAAALRRGFGFLPLFRVAESEITRLVEMRADDLALASTDRRTLAEALVGLAVARHPNGSLATGGALALERVERLASPSSRWNRLRSVGVRIGCVGLYALPVGIAATPAALAAAMNYCPVIFPG